MYYDNEQLNKCTYKLSIHKYFPVIFYKCLLTRPGLVNFKKMDPMQVNLQCNIYHLLNEYDIHP